MNVTITSEYHFTRTPDGTVWTDGPCHARFLARYRAVFDRVNVVARVEAALQPAPNQLRADGDGVCFSGVPTYLGPVQYLQRARAVTRAACAALSPHDAVILNVPGQLPSCVTKALAPGRPYAVQVLGDPYQVFAPGAVRHPLRPVMRWWFTGQMQRQARGACGALYVTRESLQARYACPERMVGVSDVDLPPEAFASQPRCAPHNPKRVRLITVATMTQMYKGLDVLIDAVAACVRGGTNLCLVLVGDGKCRPDLEAQVRKNGLTDHVEFRGQLSQGDLVRAELRAADLFVLPSRTEGLPRALIEAMALGLPCLASNVGGIPELLTSEDLLPPGDAPALAAAIRAVLGDEARYRRMSESCLSRAQDYRAEALETRRTEFYRFVADRTAEWLAASAATRVEFPAAPRPCALLGEEMRR